MGQNIVSQLEVNLHQVTDVVLTKTWDTPTELQPSTLFTLGVVLGLVRLSMCDAMLGSGDARWEMEKLRAAPSNSLGAPTHQNPQHTSNLLMEPQARCCLSNLNSGWFTAVIDGLLPLSDLAMAQPWLSTSLEGGLKTSQCFWTPWRIISKDGACCPGLLLGMPSPGTQSNSQSFQMTLLWVLGTQGFSTQQPLRSWDHSPGDALKRFGLEQSCILPWKDQHRWKWVSD